MRHIQLPRAVTAMTSRQARIWMVLLAGMAVACAPAAAPGRDTAAAGTAMVEVDNLGFVDVNVYAIRAGQRIRLGTVGGHTMRSFVIPRSLVGNGTSVRFQADFIGSRRAPVSEEMVIWPGDTIELRVPPA